MTRGGPIAATLALCATLAWGAAAAAQEPTPTAAPESVAEAAAEAATEPPEAAEEPDENGHAPPDRDVPGPDYLRAGLEEIAMLSGGTIWYWLDDRNVVDWDFESWEQRFRDEAYRFDNNEFPINFIGHALNGAAFYGLPRSNRMGVLGSFLYAAATSFVWEFFLEFQERFSLNDTVVTSVGGVPLGEAFYRLGRYLDNSAHPVLAWIFGLPVAMHEALDGRAVGHEGDGPPDEPPGWARIQLRYGFEWALPSGDAAGPGFDVHRVGGRATFAAVDGYLEPGRDVRAFADAEVTTLWMEGLASSTGYGFELWADSVLVGLYARDLHEHPEGRVGTSAVLGTSVAHFFRLEKYEIWRDRISYTGFPGLAADVEEHLGAFGLRFSGRFHGVFGAAHAAGYARWRRANPDRVPKSILDRHKYWYGWGWAGRLALELTLPHLAFGGRLAYVRLDSQEGYDRREEQVERDVDGTSALLQGGAWARLEDLPLGLFVELSWRVEIRRSTLGDLNVDRRLDRFQAAVGVRLD